MGGEDMKTKHAFIAAHASGHAIRSCAGSWGLLTAGSTPGGVRPQRELNALPGVAVPSIYSIVPPNDGSALGTDIILSQWIL